MTLEAKIDDWSIEHDRNVRTVIKTTATKYKAEYIQKFPSDAMVVGDNWFYIAAITYLNLGPDRDVGGGVKLAMSEAFRIDCKKAIITTRYVDLGILLKHFENDLPSEELALFPVTERRQQETVQLGGLGRTSQDWYEIKYESKVIRVFPLNQSRTKYIGKMPDGRDVGFTPIESNTKPLKRH